MYFRSDVPAKHSSNSHFPSLPKLSRWMHRTTSLIGRLLGANCYCRSVRHRLAHKSYLPAFPGRVTLRDQNANSTLHPPLDSPVKHGIKSPQASPRPGFGLGRMAMP